MIFSNLICLFSNQIDPENENTWDYSPPRPTTQCRGHVFQSNNTKFLIYHWQMFLCHYVIEYKPNLFSLKTILLHLLVFYWAEDMEFIEVLYCFSNSWVSNWKKNSENSKSGLVELLFEVVIYMALYLWWHCLPSLKCNLSFMS